MKNQNRYGTLDLTADVAQRLQLEWDMVEQARPQARFMNFPYSELPERDPAAVAHGTDENRGRLAA